MLQRLLFICQHIVTVDLLHVKVFLTKASNYKLGVTFEMLAESTIVTATNYVDDLT